MSPRPVGRTSPPAETPSKGVAAASRPLRGRLESPAERGTPFGLALTASPLSVSKNRRKQFPHKNNNLLARVGQYCVITPGHFSLVIPIPQAGSARRDRERGAGSDARDLPIVGYRDREGACATRSCAFVVGCAAEIGAEPSDAGDQRENVASSTARSPQVAQGVLGTTSLGTRVLRGDDWECERYDGCRVYRNPRCRDPRRRFSGH